MEPDCLHNPWIGPRAEAPGIWLPNLCLRFQPGVQKSIHGLRLPLTLLTSYTLVVELLTVQVISFLGAASQQVMILIYREAASRFGQTLCPDSCIPNVWPQMTGIALYSSGASRIFFIFFPPQPRHMSICKEVS